LHAGRAVFSDLQYSFALGAAALHGLHLFSMQYLSDDSWSQSELMRHCAQLFLTQKGAFSGHCDDFLHSMHEPDIFLQYGVVGLILSHHSSGEGRPLAQLSLSNNLMTEGGRMFLESSLSFFFLDVPLTWNPGIILRRKG